MRTIHLQELQEQDRFIRANLVNSISGFKPATLIGTVNTKGQTNLALFSSIIHLGADPALIGFIQRPVGVSGDTYRNIIETKYYTINQVSTHIVERAHYTSAKFDPEVSEFKACQLTEDYTEGFIAPFVKESPVKMGLKFVEEIFIKHNNTRLVIGAIQLIQLEDGLLEEDGNIQLDKAEIVSISGLETYYKPSKIASYKYAKVGEIPES
jgi:flavin reductase (DIM6/NTAB) family NADH-FMN oxidoreductase RutF